MNEKYTEADLEAFYEPNRDWSNENPYSFTSAYVTTDKETQVPVCVYLNESNLAAAPDAVDFLLSLGSYDSNKAELSRYAIKIDTDYLEDADLDESHGSDSGIDYGWAVSLCASGYHSDDIGRSAWIDPYQLILVETSVPDSGADFYEYHKACWNVMMQALREIQ